MLTNETRAVVLEALESERSHAENMMAGWNETSSMYKRYTAEIARIDAAITEVNAETGWEPVTDGDYEGLVSRHLYVEDGGTRIGIDFDVYDCTTGDWHPMPHYTTFYRDVRLFQRTGSQEGATDDKP